MRTLITTFGLIATLALVLAAAPVAGTSPLVEQRGQEERGGAGHDAGHENGEPDVDPAIAPDPTIRSDTVVREHSIEKDGGTIHYRSTTGTLPLFRENGEVRARIFHMAYTRLEEDGDGELAPMDPATRPIMFCFNGGPGSSSVWLHLGAWGPRRVEMGDAGSLLAPPWRLIDNDTTLLDVTDLVFIDPVTTGFSRAEDGVDDGDYHGLEQDARSVAEFIRLYCTRHGRWPSPKFLGGESYGTTRAAAVASTLQSRHGMYLNGVVLVSAVLDFSTLRWNATNDLPYVLYLPTMAVTAWYHGRTDNPGRANAEIISRAAEEWAIETYMPALAQGTALPEDERAAVRDALAAFLGLSPEYVEAANLRVSPSRFQKQLLRDRGVTAGRLDGRFLGKDRDALGLSPEYDPSYAAIEGPYTATLNAYVRGELGYESDLAYEILSGRTRPWDYSGFTNRFVDVSGRLRDAMVQNPALHVFIASGYYDMATPPFATDYTFNRMALDAEDRERVETHYYEAGHMMYVHDESRVALDEHLGDFVRRAAGQR